VVATLLAAGGAAWAAPVACASNQPAQGCCANLPPGSLDCTNTPSEHHPNILLIVSDDQGYCSYRFLREAKDINGNDLLDDVGTDVPGAEDLTCRYRNSLEGVSFKKSFRFNRGTHEPLVATTGPEFVGVRTPAIDTLAAQGAVFPRMHLAANVCDPSLSALFVGKFLKDDDVKHLRYRRDWRTCACRYTNEACGDTAEDAVCDDPPDTGCTAGSCDNGTCVWPPTPGLIAAQNVPCQTDVQCENPCGETRTVTRLLHDADIQGDDGYYTFAGPKVLQTEGVVGRDDAPDYRSNENTAIGRFSCQNTGEPAENCHGPIPRPATAPLRRASRPMCSRTWRR
jgi:hypothetical protein